MHLVHSNDSYRVLCDLQADNLPECWQAPRSQRCASCWYGRSGSPASWKHSCSPCTGTEAHLLTVGERERKRKNRTFLLFAYICGSFLELNIAGQLSGECSAKQVGTAGEDCQVRCPLKGQEGKEQKAAGGASRLYCYGTLRGKDLRQRFNLCYCWAFP